jgi:hypothetical protein
MSMLVLLHPIIDVAGVWVVVALVVADGVNDVANVVVYLFAGIHFSLLFAAMVVFSNRYHWCYRCCQCC